MDDLISRQAAIDAIDRERKNKHLFNTAEDGLLEARGVINTLPSAEPERKRGKWNQIISIPNDIYGRYYCSECGKEGIPFWYFCPNCGADMRGE